MASTPRRRRVRGAGRGRPGVLRPLAVMAALPLGVVTVAFTSAAQLAPSFAGLYSVAPSGVTVTSTTLSRSSSGAAYVSVSLQLLGDQSLRTVRAGFGSATSVCSVASYDPVTNRTAATCAGLNQATGTSGWTVVVTAV